jgi:hypothetical protein
VADEATRMIVKDGRVAHRQESVPSAHTSGPDTDRIVKYIANSAAKNISSDDKPHDRPDGTMFGLVRDTVGRGLLQHGC